MAKKVKRSWVVIWLDGSNEVHEEYPREATAYRRARGLGARTMKVIRHEVWEEGDPTSPTPYDL